MMNIKKIFWFSLFIGFTMLYPDNAQQTYWPPSLRNCGNTCFLNASLQALINIYPLSELLTTLSYNPYPAQTDEEVTSTAPYYYTQLVREFEERKSTTKAPVFSCKTGGTLKRLDTAAYDLIRFTCGSQQDATEFITLFLSRLLEQNTNSPVKKAIKALFEFKIFTTINCSDKGDVSTTEGKEPHTNLFVDAIHEDTQKYFTTLEDSLAYYFDPQRLEEYTIEGTTEKRSDCTKKIGLRNAPEILLVALKRMVQVFDEGTDQMITTKLYNPVTIPLQLNIDAFVQNAPQDNRNYHLIGAVVQGGTAGGGHYWAYVKNGDQWYKCDDSQISRISIDDPTVQQEINGNGDGSATGYFFVYEKELTPAEIARRKAEELRRAQKKAAAKALRKQQERERARQEAADKAEKERKAAELKKLSDQLNILTRQLEDLTRSLGQVG